MFPKGKIFIWLNLRNIPSGQISKFSLNSTKQWFGTLGCIRWRSYTCRSTEHGWSGRVWETNENWGDWRKIKRSDENQFITFSTGKCYFSINWWKRTYSLSVSNPNHFLTVYFHNSRVALDVGFWPSTFSLGLSWTVHFILVGLSTLTSTRNTLMIRIHGLISFLGTLNWPVYYKTHWVVMPKQ